MTTTPPQAPDDHADDGGPRATRDEIRDLGRLRRSATDRKVAGVAGGLARHLDVDPLVLRVAFVVLVFFGGAGLVLYVAGWLLVPDEESGGATVTLDDRSRTVALVIAGVVAALALVGDSWGADWFPWPLAVLALLVLLFWTRRDRRPAPPAASSVAWQPPPRDPRRNGPVLFWFTLALIALGVGVLGIIDVAGVAVHHSAYPTLAVGLTGLMLLVGSVYGRAGGLILLGLVSTVAMAGASAADDWENAPVVHHPTSSTEVRATYGFGAGELVLDLTEVSDPENLGGRIVRLEGGIGRIEVIVPAGLDVTVDAEVGGPGSIWLFGEQLGGVATELSGETGEPSDAQLTLDAQLGVGEIHVDQE